MKRWSAFVLCCLCAAGAVRAQAVPGDAAATGTDSADALAPATALLRKQDYAAAKPLLLKLVAADPANNRALFLLANAELGLREFPAAEQDFRRVLQRDKDVWPAHSNLVLLYAESGQWPKFEAERSVIASARAAHTAGLPAQGTDVIDDFAVNGRRVIVHQYDPPQGPFHTKYNVAYLDEAGKLAGWISCESDDADQTFFERKHPTEAAAGQRSYSLDGYSAVVEDASGEATQTHTTIKFYEDGEPAYQQVRSDAIAYLQGKLGALSQSTPRAGK